MQFGEWLQSQPATPLLVIVAYVLAGLAVMPVMLLIAVTGMVFGPWLGALYALTGSLANAAATYGVGRVLGRDMVRRLAGERINKLLLYTVMTSRKMTDPLAVQVLSGSGAGKSHLQDAVLSLCPDEDLIKLTSLSNQALFYKGEDSLRHKVLAVEEVAGAEGARYAMVRGSEASSPATPAQVKTRILDTSSGIQDGQLTVTATGLGGDPGDKVIVETSYAYDVLFGMIPGLNDMTLTARSEVIIQH